MMLAILGIIILGIATESASLPWWNAGSAGRKIC